MLDADPKAVSKLILYTGNLDQAGNTTYNNVFCIEKRKKKTFRCFRRNFKIIVNLFCFNIISLKNDSV